LGYEGKSIRRSQPKEPTRANDDEGLRNDVVGVFWLMSVSLIHSGFIGCLFGHVALAPVAQARLAVVTVRKLVAERILGDEGSSARWLSLRR
jgi:hypothetical protein